MKAIYVHEICGETPVLTGDLWRCMKCGPVFPDECYPIPISDDFEVKYPASKTYIVNVGDV